MTERSFFNVLLIGWFALSAVVFLSLQLITAPYGRHRRRGWGPELPSTVAWVLMELPAVATFPICFWLGDRHDSVAAIVFLLMWEAHYVHRTIVYPLRRRGHGHPMPLVIALMGLGTNIGINYLNARWLFTFGPERPLAWLLDVRFVLGALLFAAGLAVNIQSDEILRRLRARSPGAYAVPRGGAYRWISCPNYLAEIVEWTGWALATWSLPGLAFATWTASNLVPRAGAHHRWYRAELDDYPKERRALIPYVW